MAMKPSKRNAIREIPGCLVLLGDCASRNWRRGVPAAVDQREEGSDSAENHNDGRCGKTTAALVRSGMSVQRMERCRIVPGLNHVISLERFPINSILPEQPLKASPLFARGFGRARHIAPKGH